MSDQTEPTFEGWNAFHDRDERARIGEHPAWEAMYRDIDFSWAGLADARWDLQASNAWAIGPTTTLIEEFKRWRAPMDFPLEAPTHSEDERPWKEATLQDYWRWVPGEDFDQAPGWARGRLATDEELKARGVLVEHQGKWWHVAHMPSDLLRDKTGAGAEFLEACNVAWRQAIQPRLVLTAASRVEVTQFGDLWSNGRDDRLQAAGTRRDVAFAHRSLLGPDTDLHLSAPVADSWFWSLDDMTIGPSADFRCSRAPTHMRRAKFGPSANFTYALGFTDAEGADFGDGARFYHTAFTGDVKLDKARFGAFSMFESALFGGRTTFWRAVFEGAVEFKHARLPEYSDFTGTKFKGPAGFSEVRFGSGLFIGCEFTSASFYGATFGEGVSFASAVFTANVSFSRATLSGANFRNVRFEREASFTNARIDAGNFDNAAFLGPALFGGEEFGSGAHFFGPVTFRASTFHEFADFSWVQWPENARDQQGALEGARFRDVVDFKIENFSAFSIFDGAALERRLLLTETAARGQTPERLMARALKGVRKAVQADRRLRSSDKEEWEIGQERRGPDARYGALAGGLRTLKLAMAAQSDVTREQRFYRYELKTRARMPSEPWTVSIASRLYGIVSDYGASIGRPLLALLVVIIGFAAIYYLASDPFGLSGKDQTTHIWQSWAFSWDNVFRPLSALTGDASSGNNKSVAYKLLNQRGEAVAAAIRALSTLQSLLAIILGFLFALGVRRRFQMN